MILSGERIDDRFGRSELRIVQRSEIGMRKSTREKGKEKIGEEGVVVVKSMDR